MATNQTLRMGGVGWSVRRWWISGEWIRTVLFVLLALFSFAMFYPFVWLLFSSFKTGADIVRIPVTLWPQRWTLDAYQMVLDPTRANLPVAYVNSILVTTGARPHCLGDLLHGRLYLCPVGLSGAQLSLLLHPFHNDGALSDPVDSALHCDA
ncbi:MAG: hypothetical protein R3E79_41520 [Caldilineaceae bacterium]